MAMVTGHPTIVQSINGTMASSGIKLAFTCGRPFSIVHWGVVVGSVVSSGGAVVKLRGYPGGVSGTAADISILPTLGTGTTLGGTAGNTFISYNGTELSGDPELASITWNPGDVAALEVTTASTGGANSVFFLEAIVYAGYGRTLYGETAGQQVSLTRTWNTATAYTPTGTIYLVN